MLDKLKSILPHTANDYPVDFKEIIKNLLLIDLISTFIEKSLFFLSDLPKPVILNIIILTPMLYQDKNIT